MRMPAYVFPEGLMSVPLLLLLGGFESQSRKTRVRGRNGRSKPFNGP